MSDPGMTRPGANQPAEDPESTSPPGPVAAAAFLGLILAVVQGFSAFFELFLAAKIPDLPPRDVSELPITSPTVMRAIAGAELVVAALLVWGAIAVARRNTDRILFFTAMLVAILSVLGVVGGGIFSIAGLQLILAGITLGRLRTSASREWFE